MSKIFKLYVPPEYTFENYFCPRIVNREMECFDVDHKRHGFQRKGNNHLVLFLDLQMKMATAEFLQGCGEGADEFHLKTLEDIELFKNVFEGQKEVAVYSLAYQARMAVIAWKMIMEVAENEQVLVLDDSGKLMRGPECVEEHKRLMVPENA